MNGLRCIEKFDPAGILFIIKNAEKLLAIINPEVDWSFNYHLINHYIKICKGLIKNEGLFKLDSNVQGLDLVHMACEISRLSNTLLTEYNDKYNFSGICTTSVFFACASGNNRTGLQEFHCNLKSLYQWLGQSGSRLSEDEVAIILAISNHMQLIKGFQGGDYGLDGVRPKSAGTMPSYYPPEVKIYIFTHWSDIKTVKDLSPSSKSDSPALSKMYFKIQIGNDPAWTILPSLQKPR